MVAGWAFRDRRIIEASVAAVLPSVADAADAPDPDEHGAVPAGNIAKGPSVRAAPGRKPKPLKLAYPDATEDQYQESVANLLDAILKPEEAIYTHVGHGGYQLSGAARGRLMRLGLKRGWPDICIAYAPGRMLWLEFKTALGRLSLDQRQRHAQLEALGHVVVVCRWRLDWAEDIVRILETYGVPFRRARIDGDWYGKINQGDAPVSQTQSPESQVASTETVG